MGNRCIFILPLYLCDLFSLNLDGWIFPHCVTALLLLCKKKLHLLLSSGSGGMQCLHQERGCYQAAHTSWLRTVTPFGLTPQQANYLPLVEA